MPRSLVVSIISETSHKTSRLKSIQNRPYSFLIAIKIFCYQTHSATLWYDSRCK